ncbi:hypothetical protein BO70DRAFT_429217 [Aspergillus heteromorphus CBS 117.55]|uniref:MARVEL domain-containing protein n=1 Tax=Aspergillus heteromorphus CBS 117.55 TaxID=1448321 RepID=A0A317W6B6_9EURO|nr:uncharacterized protein BO70DRAFT_429217 [Aspergillus heteromorphus CBS 117.55]PWY82156.1 hypothetical protein BO70DRAFT_429217 [Aspergillus heteromorphus CBS 117.55]
MAKPIPPNRGARTLIIHAVLRILQITLAIIIAALYGIDLAHATKSHTRAIPSWVYAEFVAAVSAITSLIYVFVFVRYIVWILLDGLMVVLWVAQVGVFGSLFISNDTSSGDVDFTLSVLRMRVAVGLDLVMMVLWVLTAGLGVEGCVWGRKLVSRKDGGGCGMEVIVADGGDVETGEILCGEKETLATVVEEEDEGKGV